jgi:hypothetical protein
VRSGKRKLPVLLQEADRKWVKLQRTPGAIVRHTGTAVVMVTLDLQAEGYVDRQIPAARASRQCGDESVDTSLHKPVFDALAYWLRPADRSHPHSTEGVRLCDPSRAGSCDPAIPGG